MLQTKLQSGFQPGPDLFSPEKWETLKRFHLLQIGCTKFPRFPLHLEVRGATVYHRLQRGPEGNDFDFF
jgi:hypothetical protein